MHRNKEIVKFNKDITKKSIAHTRQLENYYYFYDLQIFAMLCQCISFLKY